MRDQPDGQALIAECLRVLRDELAPSLSGETRFKALMIANALGMAQREFAHEEASLAGPEEGAWESDLVTRIRRGALAGSPETYAALRRDVLARVAISNPKALKGG